MPEDLFQFGDFVLDGAAYELRRGDEIVPLQRIPLKLLFLLVECRGQIVTREEILERVWGKGVFVDIESGINTAVRKLRRALSDDPDAPRFVVTVPARGYRFVSEVRHLEISRTERFRPRSPALMVGRESELASLLSGLEDANARRGRLFLISGEPGVGKTRLADEVAAEARLRRMVLLAGHCSEHEEAVAYLPFVEILENFVDRVSDPDHVREALGDQAPELARLLPKLKSLLPGLAPPLDLQPAQARRHLFNCVLDFVARVALHQPILMILEDLHWADDSTLALLDHLAQRLSDLPMMVVGTYRDAELNVRRELAKTLEDLLRGRRATRVALGALPRDEVAAMLSSLSGKSVPGAVVGEIYAETNGNPFFVEELFRYLEEEKRLYDATGKFHSELKIGEQDAPPSVRLVVARRLGRLSEASRKMLATAALIGRSFGREILQAAAGQTDPDSLLECIEEGERAGLLTSVAQGSGIRFAFSHELIRQAVISSLSPARRQRLHLEIATASEKIYSAALETNPQVSLRNQVAELAHHYALGGDPRKAVKYCLRSIRQLEELGSFAEAIAQFANGLELTHQILDENRRADMELDLRIAVSGSLGDSKGLASLEIEQSTERAMVLCQRPGINRERAWWALYSMFWIRHLRPETQKACEIAEELVEQAGQHGQAMHQAEADLSLAWTRMYAGDFEIADQRFDHGWALLESINRVSDLTPQPLEQMRFLHTLRQLGTAQNNRVVSGWNLWFLGYPERALERMTIATHIADSGTRPMLADIHGFASYIHELRGEPAQMRSRAEARLAMAIESGYSTGRALSEIYLGWADALAGDHQGGIARMRHHLAELKAIGSEYISDRCLAFIAIALVSMKRFDEGLRTLDEAFSFVARTGQRFYEAELFRLKGELLLAQMASNAAAAEQSFRTAIEISRKQRAKSWELRATTSLAQLMAKQRKRGEARRILGEIYGWFTEGFDTSDLKDAKDLLTKLKA
jgi:DNA-binding winged helix-turn-helix (wHTH) protein